MLQRTSDKTALNWNLVDYGVPTEGSPVEMLRQQTYNMLNIRCYLQNSEVKSLVCFIVSAGSPELSLTTSHPSNSRTEHPILVSDLI
jgi:hypothetical protein